VHASACALVTVTKRTSGIWSVWQPRVTCDMTCALRQSVGARQGCGCAHDWLMLSAARVSRVCPPCAARPALCVKHAPHTQCIYMPLLLQKHATLCMHEVAAASRLALLSLHGLKLPLCGGMQCLQQWLSNVSDGLGGCYMALAGRSCQQTHKMQVCTGSFYFCKHASSHASIT
jgi:hypothetical protein